ncbi:gamma carbonic anhydrase family protein [bacterium]|nr:gamma carbonic anhydrase family protein [bacterium]
MIKEFEGKKPDFENSAFLAENATLIGNVQLATDSSVWFGAVLRADLNSIIVGKRSNIQDLCVIHVDTDKPVVIGEDVTIGHSATIHGSTLEDRCLIGMGAVILDGATIGTGAIVAANSLVPPGRKVPPKTLVAGIPAKTLRELTDKDYEDLKHHAESYVELAKRHA